MLNLQLFLENQEVELNSTVSFPLNKSFDNLWNPTDIIVEYSKSINIPATIVNNKLMANAYRIDRQFIINNTSTVNLGIYLDPLKRVPMKLIYNNSILLDGYAKYVSSTVSETENYYTFNLYGALGDVFQKLMDCVFDENKLTDEQRAEEDGGQKYVIHNSWVNDVINKELVERSFSQDSIAFDNLTNPTHSIGFAPAYRGYYDNFESGSILIGENTSPQSVENILKEAWITNYMSSKSVDRDTAETIIETIDMNMILPNGLSEHNLKQFRACEQKPYIYFHALMRMYQEKCKELTGYEIRLDSTWFSANNPYWSRLCYMLDYLSVKGNTVNPDVPLTGYHSTTWDGYSTSASYLITDDTILSQNDIIVKPFTLCLENTLTPYTVDTNPASSQVGLMSNVEISVEITATSGTLDSTIYFWGGRDYSKAGGLSPSKYTKENFITVTEKTEYSETDNKLIGRTYMTIPQFIVSHKSGGSLSLSYKVTIHPQWTGTSAYCLRYHYNNDYVRNFNIESENSNFNVIFPNTNASINWRTNTTCEMKNLYTKDDSLFSVILQYTKMFGLVWKCDYNRKTIDILTRHSYFNDYQLVNWTDKIDKSQSYTVEPVSFSSKYISFNYADTEGYRYSGYRNKYGIDYGEKRIKTRYNFDNNETEFFKDTKLQPSSVSCKSFNDFNDLLVWNGINLFLFQPASETDFIDCEDDEQKIAISLNNWYFRNYNIPTNSTYCITDPSSEEISSDKYYWVENSKAVSLGIGKEISYLPQFTPVFKAEKGFGNMIGIPVGCLFNCPNEDYSKSKMITEAAGNYVYDNFWSDYINERYNSNNKKLTCYVKLTPYEFEKFNFSTFIVIDNQLFILNKIFDFDINKRLTKVELIQVSDISGYTSERLSFPVIAYDKAEINITTDSNFVGYSDITISTWPAMDYGDYAISPVSVSSDASKCIVEDAEINGMNTTLYITFESDSAVTEEYVFTATANGETITIPILINKNI